MIHRSIFPLLMALLTFSTLLVSQQHPYINPFETDLNIIGPPSEYGTQAHPAVITNGTWLISYENYSSGSWIVYGKGLKKYLNGNVVLSCSNNWAVNEYTFNDQNKITEYRQNTFAGPFYRWLNTYYPSGKPATILQQVWDWEITKNYVNVYKTVRIFDANDVPVKDSVYAWSHNTWELYSQTLYTTNSKGHILTQTTQNYTNGLWANTSRSTFTRDTSGNPLMKFNEFWSSSAWFPTNSDSSVFMENKLVEVITKKYPSNIGVNNNRRTLTYDLNGDNAQIVYYWWNSSMWNTISRDVYSAKPDRNIILHHPHNGTYYSSDDIVAGWTSNGVASVNIWLSSNNGTSWSLLSGNRSTSQVGFYIYRNTSVNSDQCLFKVTDALDGSVTDQSATPFSLRPYPAFLLHETGNVQLTVYNTGKIGGGDNEQNGGGFNFRGKKNPLFRAGAMAGVSSISTAGLFGFLVPSGINNFVQSVPLNGFTSNTNFGQISDATFTLPNTPSPLNQLSLRQRSYSKTGDDHVFFIYSVKNTSSNAVSGFHMGFNADWDIGTATENLGGISAENSLVYQYNQNGVVDSNYYGIVALNSFSGGKVTTSGNTGTVEGWTWISSVAPELITGPGDYRSFIGSGPFTIPAQGQVQAGFAMVGAASLNELKTKAAALKQVWQSGILSVEDPAAAAAGTFALSQNFPNPFNPSTTIRYALSPNPSPTGRGDGVRVKLTIHDLLGREIATLVDEEQLPGWKEVEWNAEPFANGIYFSRLTAGGNVITKKMVLIK